MAKYIVTLRDGAAGEERTFWSGDGFSPFHFVVGQPSEPVELTDEQRASFEIRGTVEPVDAVKTTKRPKTAEEG